MDERIKIVPHCTDQQGRGCGLYDLKDTKTSKVVAQELFLSEARRMRPEKEEEVSSGR